MFTRENAKQARFFLRLLTCSLVSGIALAIIIAGSFRTDSLFSDFLKTPNEPKTKVQLNVLNPKYLDINFGLRGLEPESTKEHEIKDAVTLNPPIKTKPRKKISKNKTTIGALVQVRKLEQKPSSAKPTKPRVVAQKKTKDRNFAYKVSKETVVSNKLTTTEFIELQEMMMEEQFAYEESDQYIAEQKAEEENRNTKKLLASLQMPPESERKVQPVIIANKSVVTDKIAVKASATKKVAKSLPNQTVKKAPAPPIPYVRLVPSKVRKLEQVAKLEKQKMRVIKEAKIESAPIYKLNKSETDSLASMIAALNEETKAPTALSKATDNNVNTQFTKPKQAEAKKPSVEKVAKEVQKPAVKILAAKPKKAIPKPRTSPEPKPKPDLEEKLVSILTDTYESQPTPLSAENNAEIDKLAAESGQSEYSDSEIAEAIAKVAETEKNSGDESKKITSTGLYAVHQPAPKAEVTTQKPTRTSQPVEPAKPVTTQVVTPRPAEAKPGDIVISSGQLAAKKSDAKPEEQESASAPAEITASNTDAEPPAISSVASVNTGPVEVRGILTGAWKQASGHYEVGFYNAINSLGEPVGAPVRLAILPPGKRTFKLKLSSHARGYIFAKLYPAEGSKNVPQWHAYGKRLEIARYEKDTLLSVPVRLREGEGRNVAAILAAKNAPRKARVLTGRISAMFSNKNSPLWVNGARVRLRGTKIEAVTSQDGKFRIETAAIGGRALLEVLAPGYLPRVVEASFEKDVNSSNIELASRSAVKFLARSLGISQSDDLSVLVIDTGTIEGVRLPGISTQLSLKAEGPFYFNEQGFPDRALMSTTLNGKLIYFNVEPGIGFLETFVLGQNVSPVVVSVLEGNELLHKNIRFSNQEVLVRGKLFDPIESRSGVPLPIAGARVRVAGSVDWTETDSFGSFELPMFRYAEGSEILLEVSARGYYKHRFSLRISSDKATRLANLKLFVFPKSYISDLASSVDLDLNPNKGLLIGKISLDEKVRIDTLSEHSSNNLAKDYYFDENNILRGSYAFTQPRNGLFSVFNVSPGRALLHGYNPDGTLRYSGISYFSPSTVNVIVE